jgi:hypothetical protein
MKKLKLLTKDVHFWNINPIVALYGIWLYPFAAFFLLILLPIFGGYNIFTFDYWINYFTGLIGYSLLGMAVLSYSAITLLKGIQKAIKEKTVYRISFLQDEIEIYSIFSLRKRICTKVKASDI